jgi:site-specific DNA-methyltransferase (adenine-specific)
VPPFRAADLGVPFSLCNLPREGQPFIRWVHEWLRKAIRRLKPSGHFYVYGLPAWLPQLLTPATELLQFKYWIAIRTQGPARWTGLKPEQMALALFCRKSTTFHCNPVRYPHPVCEACGRTQKDYGGRSHLLNPAGCLISDVWKDLTVRPESNAIPEAVIHRALAISAPARDGVAWIVTPRDMPCPKLAQPTQLEIPYDSSFRLDPSLVNAVHQADILEFLQRLPDNSVDLAFGDPPYNLSKEYGHYSDDQAREEYLHWCRRWLTEYARVLKPGGALMALNLPIWSIELARELSSNLYLQNWIVWDALSEPRGRILPAHYALLYWTKGPHPAVLNHHGLDAQPGDVPPPDAPVYCLRALCRRRRAERGQQKKIPLSDIWMDMHRIRHRRDRDHHPCQLPASLMERIVLLTTPPGGIVLDALAGTGTTAVTAAKLGRRFIVADMDPHYVELTRGKLAQLTATGDVRRERSPKGPRSGVTKRALQEELARLAEQLGHLPTMEEASALGRYPIDLYREKFPFWSRALGAARARLKRKGTP